MGNIYVKNKNIKSLYNRENSKKEIERKRGKLNYLTYVSHFGFPF